MPRQIFIKSLKQSRSEQLYQITRAVHPGTVGRETNCNTSLRRMNSFLPHVFKNKLSRLFLLMTGGRATLVEPWLPSTHSFRLGSSSAVSPSFLVVLCCPWRHRAASSLAPLLCPCHLQSCCKSRHRAWGQSERNTTETETQQQLNRGGRWTRSRVLIIVGICPLKPLLISVSTPLCQFPNLKQKLND